MAPASNDSNIDAVVIDHDDISNYNPEHILPEPPEEIRKIRTWLQPTAYSLESGEYRKHLGSHVAGTGSWLTASKAYQDWLNGNDHGLLWIKGIPGSGKSVLAAMLTHELSRNHSGGPALFFFFRQIIDANHEPVALLRDWLDQVLDYSPPLQKQLKTCIDDHRTIDSMSMEDLWKHLRLAFSGLPSKVFCVADALDEMDQGNDTFLSALAALGQWKPAKVKVLITSRPVPSVEGPLRTAKALHIRLQEKLVDRDISSFVQHGLRQSTISPSYQELIKEAIPGRANGLFLYAKLAMDAFLEPDADIKGVLRALPADLNEMYTNLLHEHARRSGVPDDIQLLILQWVTHATRPLRLLEVAEMINVTYLSEAERDLKSTKDLVRAAVGPLLEILPDETVCVIHHSLTEYLKGSTRPGDHTGYAILRPGPTHERLALACLAYMQEGCLDKIKLTKRRDDEQDEDSLDEPRGYRSDKSAEQIREEQQLRLKYPFLAYATANWHVHALRSTAVGHSQDLVNAAIMKFFNNPQRMNAWLKLEWNGGETAGKRVTVLHIAAKTGLIEYTKRIIASGEVNVNARDIYGKTPIWWAATSGQADIIRILVKEGGQPDQEEKICGLKPLHEAAKENHFDAVRALLEAGVDPLTPKTCENPGRICGNAPRSKGHTPLMYACHNGHLEAVDVFLAFIEDINAVHRALTWAAERGHAKVVDRILQHPGVDVNEKVRGDTPLFSAACKSGDPATITALIKSGADPTIHCRAARGEFSSMRYCCLGEGGTKDPSRGLTAFHKLLQLGSPNAHTDRALESDEQQSLFSLFMKAGADIHHRTPSGSTALHQAANNPVFVRLLLDAGADANATTDSGDTPLHSCHDLDSMALLIENGNADIDRTNSDQQTPLLSYLASNNGKVLLKFLEYGPNIDIKDKDGNGALHIAVKGYSSNTHILKAILAAGGDPNLKNRTGQTPLHIMRMDNYNSTEMLDCLLKAGANINEPDRDGTTIFYKAVSNKLYGSGKDHKDLKDLLDRGAATNVRDSNGRTLLHEAVRIHEGQPDNVYRNQSETSRLDFLIGLGLDVHAVDHRGNSLLHELALHRSSRGSCSGPKYLSLWKQLVGLGLEIDGRNRQGRTVLHMLCSRQSSTTIPVGLTWPIDFVISTIRNINSQDRDGIAPLHLAVTCCEVSARRLLSAGADPSLATSEGLTPLHLAARSRRPNTVGLLLDFQKTKDKEVINALDQYKQTPLYYACRSGRPETVELLLNAGADAKHKNIFRACAEFEDEQELWRRNRHETDVDASQSAAGLKLRDQSRPPVSMNSASNNYGRDLYPDKDTARLEEIIDMLIQHEVEPSSLKPREFFEGGALGSVAEGRGEYTLSCLLRAYKKLFGDIRTEELPIAVSYAVNAVNYSEDARAKALKNLNIKKGESNQSLFMSLLKRREYGAVEQLFHLGVDFLRQDHRDYESSNIGLLAKNGFASLLEKIGSMEAEAKLKDGECHAFGDKTKPGLFMEPNLKEIEESYHKRKPLLLQAVQRELPNMDIVRLLVEKFRVDTGECLLDKQWTKDNVYELVPYENPMHYLAKGCYWWNVALALPYLISQKVDINARNYKKQTPLHFALGGNGNYLGPYHKEAARILVEAGADVNAVDDNGNSCLAYAGNDMEMIRLLIKHGATVKADALFSAIDGKQVEILKALLSTGVSANMRREPPPPDPNAPKRKSQLPSMFQIQRLLFEDDFEPYEWYPIHYAATKHEASSSKSAEEQQVSKEAAVQMVETLLANGADPFSRFKKGRDHILFDDGNEDPEEDDDESDVESDSGSNDELLPSKTDTSCLKTKEEGTILHELIHDCELVHPFLRLHNLDPNHRDPRGQTLLHAACHSGFGPDVPIDHLYITKGQQSTASSFLDHLLKLGADPLAVDKDSRNALHHMLHIDKGGYIRDTKCLESLKKLAKDHPSLLDGRDMDGRTPFLGALAYAICERDTSAAEALLDVGANPNVVDNYGNTALHFLARRLYESPSVRKLFSVLLDKGLDINSKNNKGETPIFGLNKSMPERFSGTYSVDRNDVDEAAPLNVFEAAGANLFTRNEKGQTLLHIAARGHASRFKALMDKKLDPMIEDDNRRTALDVAAACGNEKVLGLFERKDGKLV